MTTSLGPGFWRIWATQTLSIIGSTVSGIGVAVHVYVTTGDARWLGYLTAVAAAPAVLVSPFLRRLDRVPRRSALIAGDCLAVTGPLAALLLVWLGQIELWHLVVASAATGVGNAVQSPALSAAVPAVLGNTHPQTLAKANSLFQLGPAAGIVLGPAIAAPLVAWQGLSAVLLLDVVTFAVAMVATVATPFADLPTESSDTGADAGTVTDDGSWRVALRWLRTDGRALVVLLVAIGVVNLCLAFFNVSILAVSLDVGGVSWAGLPIALGGLAMVAASLAAPLLGLARRPVRVAAASLGLTALGCVLAASRPSLLVVTLGVMVALAPMAVVNGGIATLFHTAVPTSMHGRVFALRSTIGRSLDPIGAALAGVVVAQVAGPAMAQGGALAGSMGRLLGTGAPRGATLVLAATGLALLALAMYLGADRRLRTLDQRVGSHAQIAPDPTAETAETAEGSRERLAPVAID